MNVEIKYTESDNNVLLINGVVDNQTEIVLDVTTFQVFSSNPLLIEELKRWPIDKFEDFNISLFSFEVNNDIYFEKTFFLLINDDKQPGYVIDWWFKSENWNKAFSISDFVNEMESLCNDEIIFERNDDLSLGFGIKKKVADRVSPIKQYFESILDFSNEIEEKIEKNMLKRLKCIFNYRVF